MKFLKILFILIFILSIINFASAEDINFNEINITDTNTIYVNNTYTGSIEDGSQNHPYKTLYSGITSATRQAKSNLYISNGEYNINRVLTIRNANLNIIGESSNVIINAQNTSSILQISQGNYTISNIKFINGNGYKSFGNKSSGGAISINSTSTYSRTSSLNLYSLKIYNCVFENNIAYNGGAISGGQGNLTISNCQFKGNKAENGGSLYIDGCSLTLKNTILQSNTASSGGALYSANSYIKTENSKFIENNAKNGGGAYFSYGIISIFKTDFIKNIVNSTKANGGGLYLYEAHGEIKDSQISENEVYGTYISSSALYNINSINLLINDTHITNNKLDGKYGYGSIISNKGYLTIINSQITGNTMKVSNNISDLIYNLNGYVNLSNNNIKDNTFKGEKDLDNIYLLFNPYITGNIYPNSIYPSKYDLRNITLENGTITSWLTSVKNQGAYGTCWAFATLGALESYLLKNTGVYYNFSVNHLKNLMGNTGSSGYDLDGTNGGNFYLSAAYLTRWSGPVNETEDPYVPSKKYSSENLTVLKHIQDLYFIPLRSDYKSIDDIKGSILKYGALAVMYHSSDLERYVYTTSSTIYGPLPADANHAVLLVGWDDNYPKSNFNSRYGEPAGDGAFIIKNSWGSNLGEQGYYYISYYDESFGGLGGHGFTGMVYGSVEENDNYKSIYEYDPLGDTLAFLGFNNETGWFANIYTATTDDPLQAFSIITSSPNSKYYSKIYVNNELKETLEGELQEPGYHTIKLNNYIRLNKGDTFKIIVKLTSPNFNYPIAIETKIEDLSSKVTAEEGQSYISPDGEKWYDIAKDTVVSSNSIEYYERVKIHSTNVCLKAFTANLDETNLTCENLTKVYLEDKDLIGTLYANTTPLAGQHISLSLTRLSNGANKTYDVVSDYRGIYKLEINLAPGDYSAKADYNGVGNLKYSITPTVSIKVKSDNRTDTQISLLNYTETVKAENMKNITGKLHLQNNTPIAGENIKIKLIRTSNGASKTYNLITDTNGEFYLNLGLGIGEYQIQCTYEGSNIYYPYTTNYKLTIIK